MTISGITKFLLLCTGINYAILLIWFGIFVFANSFLYKLHTRFFTLSKDRFDAIHYEGMAVYKIGILLLNLAPLIVLETILDKAQ